MKRMRLCLLARVRVRVADAKRAEREREGAERAVGVENAERESAREDAEEGDVLHIQLWIPH